MQRYAVIENETVTNIAIADSALGAEWVLADGSVNVGDHYDSMTGTFTPAERPTDRPRSRFITKGAFRRRMTIEQKVALKLSNDPVVAVLEDDLSDSTYVDLDLQDLIDALTHIATNIEGFTPEFVDAMRVDGTEEEQYKGDL